MRVDVAVVGAGIAGAAIAFELVRRSLSVAVIERGTCASLGATATSGGIVRVYDRHPGLVELARRGTEQWSAWKLSSPAPFQSCGVVQILPESRAEAAVELARLMRSVEYPIDILSHAQAERRFPWLSANGTEPFVVLHEPRGGFCNPRLAAHCYLEAARRNGALVLERVEVRLIEDGPNVAIVQLEDMQITAEAVVVACGAWSSRWLPGAPLTAKRIQLTMLAGSPSTPEECVIDDLRDAYLGHGHGGLAFAGSGDPPPLSGADAETPICEARRARHLHFVEELTGRPPVLLADVVGVDSYTPDLLPLVGLAGDRSRLFRFTGFSGRGAKYMPAIAATAAAELATMLRG